MLPPRLVFLHGFTGGVTTFHDVQRQLSPHRFFAPRLHGHGPIPNLEATSFAAECTRLAGEIAFWSRGESSHLCGYSLGGRLALALLVRAPELFSGATLIGAHPGLVSAEERAERRVQDSHWRALLTEQGLAAFLSAWAAQPLFASEQALPPDPARRRAEERRDHTADGLASALAVLGLAEMPDYRGNVPALNTQITWMAGSTDDKFAQLAQEMAQVAPRGRAILASGSGHNLLLDSPQLVAEVLSKALNPAGKQTP